MQYIKVHKNSNPLIYIFLSSQRRIKIYLTKRLYSVLLYNQLADYN